MKVSLRLLNCFLAAVILGCTAQEAPPVPESDAVVLTESLTKVQEEFKKMDEKDRDSVYLQITGASLYLKHTTSLRRTSDFLPILGRVQSDYGWDVEKYPDFTEAVSNYLVQQGFEEPKEIKTKEDREWLYNIFNDLSLALKYE